MTQAQLRYFGVTLGDHPATDPDAALDLVHRTEAHMPSDRPGLIMRRRLLELLKEQNDPEVTRNYIVA